MKAKARRFSPSADLPPCLLQLAEVYWLSPLQAEQQSRNGPIRGGSALRETASESAKSQRRPVSGNFSRSTPGLSLPKRPSCEVSTPWLPDLQSDHNQRRARSPLNSGCSTRWRTSGIFIQRNRVRPTARRDAALLPSSRSVERLTGRSSIPNAGRPRIWTVRGQVVVSGRLLAPNFLPAHVPRQYCGT